MVRTPWHGAQFSFEKKTILWVSSFFILVLLIACHSASKAPLLRHIPRAERKGLAVLNFKNTTQQQWAAEFQPWEFGIASMLMTDIESIGLFNILSRERLKDVLREQKLQYSGLVDPDTAVEVGKLVSAHYILTGSYSEMKGRLRIEAQAFSVENGALLGSASVEDETEKFFEIEKQLVFKISGFLRAILSDQEKLIIASKVETRSVEASLNNYAGEIAVYKADDLRSTGQTDEVQALIEEAKQSFKEAISFDPEYEKAKKNLTKLLMGVPITL